MALATTVLLSNALIQNIVLEPVLTAPLLYLLLRKPQVFRDHILRRYPQLDNATLVKNLKWLVALGVGKKLSQVLNKWALNNWQIRTWGSDWQWEREIAVVTGGCSGFGERVAKGLAKKGLKVVVLDVQDLPKALEACTCPVGPLSTQNGLMTRSQHNIPQMRHHRPLRGLRRRQPHPRRARPPLDPHQQRGDRIWEDHPRQLHRGYSQAVRRQHR